MAKIEDLDAVIDLVAGVVKISKYDVRTGGDSPNDRIEAYQFLAYLVGEGGEEDDVVTGGATPGRVDSEAVSVGT